MKRDIFILLMVVFVVISGGLSIAIAADKEIPIGDTLNPKILATYSMPPELSSSGTMALQNDKYLWICTSEMFKNKEGKPDWKRHLAVFDITDPSSPTLLVIHQDQSLLGQIGINGNYAYCMYNTRRDPGYSAKKKASGLIIYDITNPLAPTQVKKTGGMFDGFGTFYINNDFMYVLEDKTGKTSSPFQVINQTIVRKVSLEDPTNPKIVSTFKGFDGKSEIIDGNATNATSRDNNLYVNCSKTIYVFDIEKEKLTASHEGSMASFRDICLADEYMAKDQTIIMTAGSTPELLYPGENKRPQNWSWSNQNGIMALVKYDRDYYPEPNLGQWGGVRIPVEPGFISSKGTLAYVIGSKSEASELNSQQWRSRPSTMLVVDFSYVDDPQFVGSLNFDGRITDYIFHGNIAYMLSYKQEGDGPDTKRQLTLLTVELPVKEGIIRQHPSSFSEIYPGYKEPEIKPKAITQSLRDEIGKPAGELSVADFNNLKSLKVEGKKITDLTGIELCTSIEDLDLGLNKITDINSLAGLTDLKKLNLRYNKIKNIDALSGLKNLEELNLSNNEITDITPLLDLPKLTKLDLTINRDIDLTPISNLTGLTELKMGYNRIFRPPSLAGLNNLKVLNLSGNGIYYTDFINDLPTGLEQLTLDWNNIRDIGNLSRLTNLKALSLNQNDIRNITPIKNLTNLEYLRLSGNRKIESYEPLSGLTKLKKLEITDNDLENADFIAKMTSLEDLDLSNINQVQHVLTDLKPLANLHNLKILNLRRNGIKDIKPLAGLTNLKELNLEQNKIEKIDALKNMKGLEKLRIQNNKIEIIQPLTNILSNLMVLDISANPVKDVKSWIGMESKSISPLLVLYLPVTIPREQIEELRKTIIIAPSKIESTAVGNLLSTAEAEKTYFDANGKYAPSLDKLISSGSIFVTSSTPNPDIFPHYQIVRFDATDKTFTIIIVPKDEKGNENSRIFAVGEDGNIREWKLSRQEFDSSIPLDNKEKWNIWTEGVRAGIYGCGPGG